MRTDHLQRQPPLLTSGDDLTGIGAFLQGRRAYRALDVLEYLLAGELPPVPGTFAGEPERAVH